MKLLKKISENFLYSNEQIGLVFLLLFIGLLLYQVVSMEWFFILL